MRYNDRQGQQAPPSEQFHLMTEPTSKYPNIHDALLEVALGVSAVAKEFGTARQINAEPSSPDLRPTDLAFPVDDIRSSNLRVKKIFTQREKDRFEREAYEYIEKYFENSLAELQRRYPNIETEFEDEIELLLF